MLLAFLDEIGATGPARLIRDVYGFEEPEG
jgi:hypothetical protein